VVATGPQRAWIGYQSPTWSPDGKLIAYYRERHKELYAYTVNWRTRRVRRVSEVLTSREGGAAVSPFVWQSLPR
jgi:Tol biopolymer transport system component